jgi:xanthine dehydrogenase accessory factor
MAKVWAPIRETIERHSAAGLLSVIGDAGSVPRQTGARIVLQPNGDFFGSIGGGRLEYEALAAARAALAAGRGKAEFRDWPLGPNLGQCCGGRVTTLTETFDASDLEMVRRFEEAERAGAFMTHCRMGEDGRIARTPMPPASGGRQRSRTAVALAKNSFNEQFGEMNTPVLLFGAGHVGRALVFALAPLPFSVRWVDSRPDQFPQYIPQNVEMVRSDASERELAEAPRGAFVIVMTHAHPLDYDITAAALRLEKFAFVGLIGSQTKLARFATFARQLGVIESAIERLVCPIGLPQIRGKEPAVIAVAVAAQLLVSRENASPSPSDAAQPACVKTVQRH